MNYEHITSLPDGENLGICDMSSLIHTQTSVEAMVLLMITIWKMIDPKLWNAIM